MGLGVWRPGAGALAKSSPAPGLAGENTPGGAGHRDPHPTGKDRLINGDDRVSRERFGRPPDDVGALASGQHLCALYQDQDEHRRLTAAVIRGALAAGMA